MTTDRMTRAHGFLVRAANPENGLLERKVAAQMAAMSVCAPRDRSNPRVDLTWHESLRLRDPELHAKLGPLVQSGLPLTEENCALWLGAAREFVAFVEAREVTS